jgi:quercetin dioxygenase-like cupin family protein
MKFGICLMSLALVLCSSHNVLQNPGVGSTDAKPTPLILEKNEGEQRVRRPRETPVPTGTFTIKVDRQNGGSQKMWLGTEEIPPGGLIPKHKHLDQDEILLIQTGQAHVWLGTQERDVHAEAVVFIPANTWISLKNTGNENIHLAFVFSDPGFDEFMRCVSVPASALSSASLSHDDFTGCQHKGHVLYEGFGAPAPR